MLDVSNLQNYITTSLFEWRSCPLPLALNEISRRRVSVAGFLRKSKEICVTFLDSSSVSKR